MKIDIRSIPSTGCEVNGALEKKDFNVRADEIECLTPVELSGRLEKSAGMVQACVTAKTIFRYTCGRCLEICDKEFCEQFDFHYPIDSQENYIDIGEDIRQEILLGFPTRVICQEQCKGLCTGCGANLNIDTCHCKKGT